MKKISILFTAIALTMTISAQTRTIYLNADIWANEGNPVFAVHVWNTGDADAEDYWLTLDHDKIYKADIREDATSAIFLRKNPADPNVNSDVWAGEWNRSTTSIPTDKELYTITSWSGPKSSSDPTQDDNEHGVWSKNGEQPQPAAKVIVKVKKPTAWTTVYAYEWSSSKKDLDLLGTWPGQQMQDLGNGWYGIYAFTDANLILNNNAAEQAKDYFLTAAVCLENIANGQAPTVAADCSGVPDPDEGGVTPPTPADVVVKIQKPASWAGMNIWAWGSSDATFMAQFPDGTWPGVAMQAIGNNWYQFTVKSDAWFLVNNGEGTQQSQAAQTTEDACYTIGTEKDGEGHFAINNYDCADVDTTEEAINQLYDNNPTTYKVIIDGQLYILYNGNKYNTLGTQL